MSFCNDQQLILGIHLEGAPKKKKKVWRDGSVKAFVLQTQRSEFKSSRPSHIQHCVAETSRELVGQPA